MRARSSRSTSLSPTSIREWRQGRKRNITVRHLLNHTSGLEDKPTAQEIYASPDFVQFALAADVASDPGTKFFYSNKATNLLAGIVLRASGTPLDEYVAQENLWASGYHRIWLVEGLGRQPAREWPGFSSVPSTLPRSVSSCSTRAVWRGRRDDRAASGSLQSIAEGQPFNPTCGLLWWRSQETRKIHLRRRLHFRDQKRGLE